MAEAERASLANEVGADLVISLHADGGRSTAYGAATYYYGSMRNLSELGRSFADIVQGEIVRRTDLLDCHSHAKTWDMLRLTQMPTVRVEVGYLTHAGDAARLSQPRFRDRLAESIAAAAVALFCLFRPPTGKNEGQHEAGHDTDETTRATTAQPSSATSKCRHHSRAQRLGHALPTLGPGC